LLDLADNNNNNNNLIYIAPACRMTSEALQYVQLIMDRTTAADLSSGVLYSQF